MDGCPSRKRKAVVLSASLPGGGGGGYAIKPRAGTMVPRFVRGLGPGLDMNQGT